MATTKYIFGTYLSNLKNKKIVLYKITKYKSSSNKQVRDDNTKHDKLDQALAYLLGTHELARASGGVGANKLCR
jgi:hypothetical protein